MSSEAATASLRAELEDERDFLLVSLDDLDTERQAGDLDDDDYNTLRDDYTARAAAVLRRLQDLDRPVPSQKNAQDQGDEDESGVNQAGRGPTRRAGRSVSSASGRRSRWTMILSIAGTLVLAGGSGYLVTRNSGERLPGQESSGGVDQSPRGLLQQALAVDSKGGLVEAARLYDAVLAAEPNNVVALSRRGWVLGRSGRQTANTELLNAGLGYLDRATKADPSYPDAHAFKGLVLGALARPAESVCEFRLWLAIAPITDDQRPAIEEVLDEAITQAGDKLVECPKPPTPVPVTTP